MNIELARNITRVPRIKYDPITRRWINNTFRSNSLRYHMHHRKNLSFLSSFGVRTVFAKGSEIAVFVSIETSKRAR